MNFNSKILIHTGLIKKSDQGVSHSYFDPFGRIKKIARLIRPLFSTERMVILCANCKAGENLANKSSKIGGL